MWRHHLGDTLMCDLRDFVVFATIGVFWNLCHYSDNMWKCHHRNFVIFAIIRNIQIGILLLHAFDESISKYVPLLGTL